MRSLPSATAFALIVSAVASAGPQDVPHPTPGNVFKAGETARIEFGGGMRWEVVDVDGETLANGRDVPSPGTLALPHSAIGGRYGAFTLRTWDDGGATTNETRFAFLPPGDVKPCHWVGTGFHYWRYQWGRGDERLLDLAAAAGIGMVRDEPSWANCEKTPGQYEMDAFHEALVDGLARRGMKFLCLLSFDNPKAYPEDPLDADAFARWAVWCADHFKGRCDTYEIWNEPHNFRFWKRYGPVYGCKDRRDPRWIRHFTEFTRKVDAALAGRGLRVGVGAEDWPALLYTMLEQGIARPHNIVTIHPYDHKQPYPERAAWLKDGFAGLRQRIDESGAKGAGIGITEVGWTTFDGTDGGTHAFVGNYPPSTFAEQAERLVRMYLIARQSGAEFVCQYDFKDDGLKRDHTEHNFGLMDYWCHPKPSYSAVAAMTRLVGNAEPQGLEPGVNPALARVYRFGLGGDKAILAAWAVEGAETVAVPEGFAVETAADLFGNRIEPPIENGRIRLTGRPVYIAGRGGRVSRVATEDPHLSDASEISLEGEYRGHLQDVWWDGGTNLWWAHTHQLLRTDTTGRILAKADVREHNAGLEVRNGKLYVAVCLMQGKTGGKTTGECHPQINVHDALTLDLLETHVLSNLTDRAGSLAIMEDGSFALGCLRPEDIAKNQARLHQLGPDFNLVRTVVLDNFEIPLGIETIKYRDGELYLSCYKGGSGLLVVLNAQTFAEKRRQKFNGATGLVFDGPCAWRGRTVQDAKTKKWKSTLIRCEMPKGAK